MARDDPSGRMYSTVTCVVAGDAVVQWRDPLDGGVGGETAPVELDALDTREVDVLVEDLRPQVAAVHREGAVGEVGFIVYLCK